MEVSGRTVGGPKIMCGPCEQGEENHIATNYCTDCNEFMCRDCTVVHERFKGLEGHTLLDSKAMPKRKISFDSNELCKWHVDRQVEYYCCSHGEKICVMCVGIRHQDCNNAVIRLQDNCTKVRGTEDYQAFVEHITALEKQIVPLKDRISSEEEYIDIYAKKITDDLDKFRKDYKDMINHIHKEALQEVASAKEAQHERLSELQTTYDALNTKVYDIRDDMERCVNYNKIQQFLSVFTLNKARAKDLAGNIEEFEESIELAKYDFEQHVDSSLTHVLEDIIESFEELINSCFKCVRDAFRFIKSLFKR